MKCYFSVEDVVTKRYGVKTFDKRLVVKEIIGNLFLSRMQVSTGFYLKC